MDTHACPRRSLLPVSGVFVVAQVAHVVGSVALDGPTAHHPPIGNFLHVTGVIVTLVAMGLIGARRRSGVVLVQATAVAVAAFLTLHHGLPVDVHVNNPFWGRADGVQWTLALAVVGSALLVVVRTARFTAVATSSRTAAPAGPQAV